MVGPQPLGISDGPAALMLVGPGDGLAELLAVLAAGREPRVWPPCAAAYRAARDGDSDGALRLLGDDRASALNRFVLAPSPEHLAGARAAAGGDPRLDAVVAAAAYASGLSDQPPRRDDLDGEFAVLALTVGAARAVEFKDRRGALRRLSSLMANAILWR